MSRHGHLITAQGLVKSYRRDAETVHALRGISLTISRGQVVALIGPSGSGKSTLLNVLCGWERVESGELILDEALGASTPEDLPWGRVALVPQALGLLEELTILDNVLMPARLQPALRVRPARGRRFRQESGPPAAARLSGGVTSSLGRATELMSEFGIDHLAARYPDQVSLGEQQRTSVARALLLHPMVVLADEPSAHQDAGWSDVLFAAFSRLAAEGSACLIATHNPVVWERANTVLAMRDGELATHNTQTAEVRPG